MSERTKVWYRRWGMATIVIAIRLGMEMFSELAKYLGAVKAGKDDFSLISIFMWTALTLVSLGNIFTAQVSTKWHEASGRLPKPVDPTQ